MSAYTVQGYLVALRIRSSKTVLVEGPSDKIFIDRVLSDLDAAGRVRRSAIVVDTTQILRAGLGARELVEDVHARAADIRTRFAGVVDREFRAFDVNPDLIDLAPEHRVIDHSLFWTRGHSIENYFFTASKVVAFLQLHFAHLLDGVLIGRVAQAFPEILKWAAALSVAAQESSTIDRFVGLLDPGHWANDQQVTVRLLTDDVVNVLALRGATAPQIATFRASLLRVKNAAEAPHAMDVVRWLTHGHIGTEAVWTAVARLAALNGADAHEMEQIARGHRDIKFRHALHQWALENMPTAIAGGPSEAPSELFAWCA